MKLRYYSLFLLLSFAINTRSLLSMNSTDSSQASDKNQYCIKTEITNPQCATFLSNTKIAIAGVTECSIINLNPKEIVINQHTFVRPICIALNSKKSLYALSGLDKINVYNAQSGELHHNSQCTSTIKRPIVFNPQNPLQLFYRQSNMLHCIDLPSFPNEAANACNGHYINNKSVTNYFVSHPTQDKFLECGQMGRTSDSTCYIYSQPCSNHLNLYTLPQEYNIISAEYDKNGDKFAINTKCKGIVIVKLDKDTTPLSYSYFDKNAEENSNSLSPYQAMQFHTNNITLALLTSNNVVEYWNSLSGKKITEDVIKLPESSPHTSSTINDEFPLQRLSISPNGKKILIALNKYCFILDVPFYAIFQGDSLHQIITAYLSLKEYVVVRGGDIPNDVLYLLFRKYLELQ